MILACYWTLLLVKTRFANADNKIPVFPQNNIDIAIFYCYTEDVLVAFPSCQRIRQVYLILRCSQNHLAAFLQRAGVVCCKSRSAAGLESWSGAHFLSSVSCSSGSVWACVAMDYVMAGWVTELHTKNSAVRRGFFLGFLVVYSNTGWKDACCEQGGLVNMLIGASFSQCHPYTVGELKSCHGLELWSFKLPLPLQCCSFTTFQPQVLHELNVLLM